MYEIQRLNILTAVELGIITRLQARDRLKKLLIEKIDAIMDDEYFSQFEKVLSE